MNNILIRKRSLSHLYKCLCFYTICLDVSFTWFQFFTIKTIIPSSVNLFVFRPLLQFSRLDFQKMVFFLKIPLFVDKTNTNITVLRNRTRKQILPIFRFCYNRQIDKVLLQFSDLLVLEHFFFKSLAEKLFNQQTNIAFLQSLPLPIQRKVIHRALQNYNKSKTHFVVVEALTNSLGYINKENILVKKVDKITLKNVWFAFCPGNGSFTLVKTLKIQTF